jgi:hypothetical protein
MDGVQILAVPLAAALLGVLVHFARQPVPVQGFWGQVVFVALLYVIFFRVWGLI